MVSFPLSQRNITSYVSVLQLSKLQSQLKGITYFDEDGSLGMDISMQVYATL